MTVMECYERMGADYDDVVRRLGNEERVLKILGMLLRDNTMEELRAAVAAEDYDTAFRAAHTLKGILMNLGLSRFAKADSELTEALRNQPEKEKVETLFEQVSILNGEMLSAVGELLGRESAR